MDRRLHDVTEEARERLRRSPYAPLRLLSCEFDRGVLRLRGSLSSFYQKQLAQEAVLGLSGVREVVNEVEVVFQPRSSLNRTRGGDS